MGRSTLIMVLIALLAGVGIGFVLAKSLETQEGEAAPPPAEPDRSPSAVKPRAELPPPPEGGYRDLAEALAAIPVPEAEAGTGVITGRVTMQDGSPVGGVVVTASRMLDATELQPFGVSGGDEDLTTLVVNAVQRQVHARSSRREARTGADGVYRIEGLADGRHLLRGVKEGYSIFTRGGGIANPGDKCDFQAQARVGIEVTVLMPDGSEPKKAILSCKAGSSTNTHHWKPNNKTVQLSPGQWQVQALAEGNSLASEKLSVAITLGELPPEVTLRLDSRPGIRGKVIVSEPQGNQYFEVALLSLAAGREADPQLLLKSRRRTHVGRHDDHAYHFPDLKPGTYLIGLIVRNKLEDSATVTVGNEMVSKDLTLGAPGPGETFILVATGPDGDPVEDLEIKAGYRSDRGNSSGSARYTGLGEGRYRVWHHLPREGRVAEGGLNYVDVTSKAFGTLSKKYVAGDTSELRFTFEKPATLKVTVSGLVGSGYEDMVDVSLSHREVAGQDAPYAAMRSGTSVDAEGNKTFGPTAPGAYDLVIYLRQEEYSSIQIASEPVTVGPGENAKVIAMPALYNVTVNVGDLPGRGSLGLRRITPSKPEIHIWSLETRDGKVVIRGIPAGTYSLRATGGAGRGQMNITVPGASVVDFEPKEANALQVSNVNAGGLLEKSGFRDGDMIVGIEGETFKGELEMQSKFMAGMAKGSVKLTVLRGARTLELELDLTEAFKGDKDIGGRMEPTHR